MKKGRHGGYHIQHQISPKKFLDKNGEQVFRHKDALIFLTPHEAAEYIKENNVSAIYGIVQCECPPSEW
jgi:hypothetical protein